MVDNTVDLWALDEVHFQQQGSRCRMWVPPETKDPIVYHHPTRKSVGYFAAVRLRDGKFFYRRENGKFNGETFWAFQKAFRETSSVDGHRVIAISDNASYHHSKIHLEWRGGPGAPLRSGFLATLQPGTEPDRKSVEANPPSLPSQPLLRIPRKCG